MWRPAKHCSCNGSAATAPAGELSPVCLSSWSSSRCSNPVTRGRSLDARREHDQGHVGGGILPSVRRSRTPPPAGRRPHVGGGIPPALRDSRTPPLARGADRRLLAPPGASWRGQTRERSCRTLRISNCIRSGRRYRRRRSSRRCRSLRAAAPQGSAAS